MLRPDVVMTAEKMLKKQSDYVNYLRLHGVLLAVGDCYRNRPVFFYFFTHKSF